MRVAVVGGGIAGLAAASGLEAGHPGAEVTLVEREERLGGKIETEHSGGFLIEGAADSFLSRKARGVGLCEEIGLGGSSSAGARRARGRSCAGGALHPLPAGLTGMIPTDLDALRGSALLSAEGRRGLRRGRPPPPPATATSRSPRSSGAGSGTRRTRRSSSR